MRRALPLICMLLMAAPALADTPDRAADDAEILADPWAASFRPMPLVDAAERVTARYQGRLLAAETTPPRPDERDLGAELVYRFRLLTPGGQALDIRLDARDGRFLDVAGRGQMQARRRTPGP